MDHGVIKAMDTKGLSLSNVSLSSRCQDHLQKVSDNVSARQFAATPGRFNEHTIFDRKYDSFVESQSPLNSTLSLPTPSRVVNETCMFVRS